MLETPSKRQFLVNGAQRLGVARIIAEAIEQFLLKEDRNQILLLLKLLSTSVGSMMLTHYPLAFQELPLAYRENVLRGFRDSRIPQVIIIIIP